MAICYLLSHSSILDPKVIDSEVVTFAGFRRLKYVPVEELLIQPGEIMTTLMSFSGASLLLHDHLSTK